jgi:quinol monooxygenase YgiN
MVTLIVYLQAKPQRAAELEKWLLRLTEAGRKDAGCIDYHFHRSADDPNTFVFYENWRSREDLEAHVGTPIQKEFGKVRGELLEGDIDLKFYNMVSPYNK